MYWYSDLAPPSYQPLSSCIKAVNYSTSRLERITVSSDTTAARPMLYLVPMFSTLWESHCLTNCKASSNEHEEMQRKHAGKDLITDCLQILSVNKFSTTAQIQTFCTNAIQVKMTDKHSEYFVRGQFTKTANSLTYCGNMQMNYNVQFYWDMQKRTRFHRLACQNNYSLFWTAIAFARLVTRTTPVMKTFLQKCILTQNQDHKEDQNIHFYGDNCYHADSTGSGMCG